MKNQENTGKQYIDVKGFRDRFGLKQSELADFLGITRGFISLIEKGTAKLPAKHIDKILDRFGICGLIPAYDRITILRSLKNDDFPSGMDIQPYIADNTLINIRHGIIPITEEIADKLVTAYPQLNRKWLMTGKEEMFCDSNELAHRKLETKLNEVLARCDALQSILERLLNEKTEKR